mmetsp:Transcript_21631/g.28374  ORF Transcript_21631/g.28374 Transcript_21631/m.28374 type:complete len:320 (-) Transcript_21631:360-1319(-)
MVNQAAEAKKAEGNQFFKSGDYRNAIEKYSEAIDIDPSIPAYWSNRSASHGFLGQWAEAAEDGAQCIRCDKNFIKGYFRLASAQQKLNQLDAAVATLRQGLGIQPQNGDLKKLVSEIEEQQRLSKVEALMTLAQQQNKSGEYGAAVKTLDQALRLDAGNQQLNALMNSVRPKFEQEEKARRSGLSRTELLKEQGDDAYKSANFEGAIEKYTQCLDALTDKSTALALKCYSNRSACYKQLSNFDGVISDCTMVLEMEPENIKALVRRAQAFEACERYRYALQDVRQVLAMPFEEVGQANYQLANGMQHRLNRVVQQLKSG